MLGSHGVKGWQDAKQKHKTRLRIIVDVRGSIDFHWMSQHARCEYVRNAKRAIGCGIGGQRSDDHLSIATKCVGDA